MRAHFTAPGPLSGVIDLSKHPIYNCAAFSVQRVSLCTTTGPTVITSGRFLELHSQSLSNCVKNQKWLVAESTDTFLQVAERKSTMITVFQPATDPSVPYGFQCGCKRLFSEEQNFDHIDWSIQGGTGTTFSLGATYTLELLITFYRHV